MSGYGAGRVRALPPEKWRAAKRARTDAAYADAGAKVKERLGSILHGNQLPQLLEFAFGAGA